MGEPFASKAQQRFAFGTGQPWAKKWADLTDFKHLPARVRKKKKNEGNTATAMGQLMRNRQAADDGSAELATLKKGKAPKAGTTPQLERDFDPNVGGGVDRDKIAPEDFAGPDRSFPIVTKADVSDALHSLGRTKHNKAAVRAKIISIAKRKGFPLPKSTQASEAEFTFGRARFVESF